MRGGRRVLLLLGDRSPFFLAMCWEHVGGTSSAYTFAYSFKWKTTCADWFIGSSGELEVTAGISLQRARNVCHRSMPSGSVSPLQDRGQAAVGGVGRFMGFVTLLSYGVTLRSAVPGAVENFLLFL